MSLRLSQKHGVAPALCICRICGKENGEIALLGAACDKVMRKAYDATDGKYGSKEGYKDYGRNQVPSDTLCDECKGYLVGGVILIAEDTREYLRLTKDMVDSLVGRVANAKGLVLDFDAIRGQVCNLPKAFWYADGDNIKLRNPKEWTV